MDAQIVQAVAAVVTAAVTIWLTALNARAVNAPHRAYLRLVGYDNVDLKWVAKVRSEKGLALGVSVEAAVLKGFIPTSDKHSWRRYVWRKGKGAPSLSEGAQGDYVLGRFAATQYPIFIKWKTITGERQWSAWRVRLEGHNYEFEPLTHPWLRYAWFWIWFRLNIAWLQATKVYLQWRYRDLDEVIFD